MIIDVYADIVCPWCYIGEQRLERALALRPGLAVERRWRPFQLQPGMPPQGLPWSVMIEQKFGGLERARQLFAHVAAVGAADGLVFDFDRVASAPNTGDAHRLILLAGRHDLTWEMATALFRAYFAEGRDLNDHAVLEAVAVAAGLPQGAASALLAGDEERAAVEESQQLAAAYGITAVPAFVIDDRYLLTGAQPVKALAHVLDAVAAGEAAAD